MTEKRFFSPPPTHFTANLKTINRETETRSEVCNRAPRRLSEMQIYLTGRGDTDADGGVSERTRRRRKRRKRQKGSEKVPRQKSEKKRTGNDPGGGSE